MVSAYDVVYPPKGRVTFDGGKNNKYERSLIPDNESPECFNVVFTNGAVESRAGSTKLNTTAVGSFTIDGIYTRRGNDGAETMIVWADGTARALAGTTFTTIASAQSVFTTGVRVGATQYENHIFFGNGYITPYKFNGTNFTRHGVPAATGVVSALSIASSTGQLNGDYRYKITYLNSQVVQGDVGTATVTVTVTAGKIHLTDIPVAPTSHGVSSRRIYRNFASGSTATYGLLATLSDNTTTSYVDNTLDASLGATPPTDNGEPPKWSVACYHQGRLFVNDLANPNFVWYSEVFEPYTFKATNFIQVADGSADLVKGLEVYQNAVVILCERSIQLNYMPSSDPTNWQLIRVPSEFGTRSPFGTFQYDNKMMFAAVQNTKFAGLAALAGSTIDPSATLLNVTAAGSDRKSDRIEPDMFNVLEPYLPNISSLVFKNKAYISVTYSTGSTNNRLYLCDFSKTNVAKKQDIAWAPITGIAATQFTVYNGKLYYGTAAATGFVYEMETTAYTDDSTAINAYYWTKEFSGQAGHENFEKDFRSVKLLVSNLGAYYMNVTIRTDSDSGDGVTQQISLDPGATIWNAFTWGTGVWGAGTAQKEVTLKFAMRGKRIQLRFSNQAAASQRFKVHGMNFTYNIKGKR